MDHNWIQGKRYSVQYKLKGDTLKIKDAAGHIHKLKIKDGRVKWNKERIPLAML